MGFLSSLFSDGVSNVVTALGDAIDKNVTSDQERLQLRNELAKIQSDTIAKQGDLDIQLEEEITKRQNSDNEHLITRLMRPVSLFFVLTMFCFISIADINILTIKDAYIPVYETLLVTMVVALFGSRGAEKVTKIIKGSNNG